MGVVRMLPGCVVRVLSGCCQGVVRVLSGYVMYGCCKGVVRVL